MRAKRASDWAFVFHAEGSAPHHGRGGRRGGRRRGGLPQGHSSEDWHTIRVIKSCVEIRG